MEIETFKYSTDRYLDLNMKQLERWFDVRKLKEVDQLLLMEFLDGIYQAGFNDRGEFDEV